MINSGMDLAGLTDALAASLPVVGIAYSASQSHHMDVGAATWVQRPDCWIKVAWSATPTAAQVQSATAVVLAYDLFPAPDPLAKLDVLPGLTGRVLAALCVLARPGAATAAQTAQAQKIVDAVVTKALAAMTAAVTPGAKT